MATQRLKVKIGSHEFDDEGESEIVQSNYQLFLEAIKRAEPTPAAVLATPQAVIPSNGALPPSQVTDQETDLLFDAGRGAGILALLQQVPSDQGKIKQLADSMLLILYGFKKKMGLSNVPTTSLTKSLEMSSVGEVVNLNRAYDLLNAEGLALKSGSGKGTKYVITPKGERKSETTIKELIKQIHPQ